MKKVSLSKLTPDMRLGRAVCYNKHVLIREGVGHLERYANRLRELGIYYLYVDDESSEGIEIQDVVSEQVRLECMYALRETMGKIRSSFTLDRRLVSRILDDLICEVQNHADTLASLSEIGNTDESTLHHSINTTIYAACLGLQLNYRRSQLLELAEGVLLHDIGKTLLSKKIIFAPRKLTPEEFEYVKTHTTLGYQLLEKSNDLSPPARLISLCHHERLDGSGYPNGLVDHEIPEYSKIAAIIDMYEALTSNRCYRRALSPSKALEILTQDSAAKLDIRLASLFMQGVAVYPNGSSVCLSDGSQAIVKKQNPSMPLRPVVRVVEVREGKMVPLHDLDLMEVLNLTITSSGS